MQKSKFIALSPSGFIFVINNSIGNWDFNGCIFIELIVEFEVLEFPLCEGREGDGKNKVAISVVK